MNQSKKNHKTVSNIWKEDQEELKSNNKNGNNDTKDSKNWIETMSFIDHKRGKKTKNKSKFDKESELNNKRNNNLNDIEETNPRRGNRHDQSTRIIKTYERK